MGTRKTTTVAASVDIKIGYHRHENGGGWVKDGLSVDIKIFIGREAIVHGGVIRGGEIRGGVIWGGVIRGGVIWGGVIHAGEIRGGEIWGGVIRGGVIHAGEIRGGEIWGGEIRGGEIWGGVIRGGVIRGGEIWGGEIWGGVIRGGVIRGGEWKKSPLFIQGSRFSLVQSRPGYIQIGCTELTVEEWVENGESIAAEHEFSDTEIEEYRLYIELFVKLGMRIEAAE